MVLMSYTVYKHTFPNGKVYIGITGQTPSRRWREGHGYEGQPVFDAIVKYGWDNIEHTILEKGLTKEQAEEKEKYYIKEYNSLSHANGYNIETGGYCTDKISEETKDKLRKALKGRQAGEKHWHYGQHWSEKIRQKISKAHKGMKYGEETRKKRSERFSGKNNPMYGVKMTEEHKAKLMAASRKACKKAVVCVETGIVYESSVEAQKQTGIYRGTIRYVCRKNPRYKTAGGFHWKYASEVE